MSRNFSEFFSRLRPSASQVLCVREALFGKRNPPFFLTRASLIVAKSGVSCEDEAVLALFLSLSLFAFGVALSRDSLNVI